MREKAKWMFLVVILVGILAFQGPAEKYFDIAKSLDIYATLFKEVNAYYVDEVEPEKLVRTSIEGMLQSLDPYTDYIPEEDVESFRIATTGQYGGIGALIGQINDKAVITDPYEGFPAFKVGLKVGDEIMEIDGQPVTTETISTISDHLKGQPRTFVEVKIKRYGVDQPLTFKIKRERISLSNISYYGLVEDHIGYIKLDDFTPGAGREVAEALAALKEQGATSVMLDLRDNPGGLLHEAVNVVNIFVPKGEEVVSTKGKVAEWNKSYKTLNQPVDTEIPVAVLANGGSASASEIVAGALQDYDRAVLIGQKTFGKGLVQTTRSLAYNARLKVTTARYYTPSGRCIQELDYAHRHEDGTVDKFADSVRSEFRTRHGRVVYDAGGLEPDIAVTQKYLGTITVALITQGKIFDYATRYCAEHALKPDMKFEAFSLDEKEYSAFMAWVKKQNFTYTTHLEKRVDELMESAKKERYHDDVEPYLESLKKKIEEDKAADLVRFKDEIRETLEREICFHYQRSKGAAVYSLEKDLCVAEAKAILNDAEALQKVFNPGLN